MVVIFWMTKVQKNFKTSVIHIQIDYQTEEQYILASILKYGSNNLIILYYYHMSSSPILKTGLYGDTALSTFMKQVYPP